SQQCAASSSCCDGGAPTAPRYGTCTDSHAPYSYSCYWWTARRSGSLSARSGVAPGGHVEGWVARRDTGECLGRPVRIAGPGEAEHGELAQCGVADETVPRHVLGASRERVVTDPVGSGGLERDREKEPRGAGCAEGYATV